MPKVEIESNNHPNGTKKKHQLPNGIRSQSPSNAVLGKVKKTTG
jgi:hypothetical protein